MGVSSTARHVAASANSEAAHSEPMRDPESLRRCAASQAGVVSRNQALAAGSTRRAIDHRVDSGVWQRLLPRVYGTFSGPAPMASRMWASVLYAGAGAVVSHASAANALGWVGEPETLHVTVPTDRRVARQPLLCVHRATLAAGDLMRVGNLPSTTPWRTVIDLVEQAESADDAIALVATAVSSRRVTADHLLFLIEDCPKLRRRSLLVDALRDVASGSNSVLEVKFAVLLRRHGVPIGSRQQRFPGSEGRVSYADMAWPGAVAELDGLLGHADHGGRHRDMDRDNRHLLADRKAMRFGWSDVVTRPCDVAAQVAAVLGASARRCGPRCTIG